MDDKIIEIVKSILLHVSSKSKEKQNSLFLEEMNKCKTELSPLEYMQVIQLLKRYFAEIEMEKGNYIVPDCRTCKYSSPSWGSGHHLSCSCPLSSTVIGEEHGLKNGWFFHPYDFDPIWLQYCDSYKNKE